MTIANEPRLIYAYVPMRPCRSHMRQGLDSH